ncbi:hypothetical protein BDZ45DRAFT_287871 [Acephala macrosclerotiorum]|nr:hypothetical protein BDZ45DRAFT_287871 [Acephala macrosclerotiorum]
MAFWTSLLQQFNSYLRLKNDVAARSEPEQDLQANLFRFVDAAIIYWIENLFRGPESANVTSFVRGVFESCQKNICEASGFTGNPDVGGIGVLIAYMLEASIVTLCWIFQSLSIPKKKPGGAKPDDSDAFYEALLDSATYFVASLCLGGNLLVYTRINSLYEQLVTNIVIEIASFSLCLAILMVPDEILRKKRVLLFFFASIVLMIIAPPFQTTFRNRLCRFAVPIPSINVATGTPWRFLLWDTSEFTEQHDI